MTEEMPEGVLEALKDAEVVAFLEEMNEVREKRPGVYPYILKRRLEEIGVEVGEDFTYEVRKEQWRERGLEKPDEQTGEQSIEEEEEPMSTENVWDTLANLRSEYDQLVEGIRQDPTLSAEGRRQRLAELYQDYGLRHKNTEQGAIDRATREASERNRRVLQPGFPKHLTDAERETFLMSYRDAASRVGAAVDAHPLEDKGATKARTEALTSLLNQADDSGDERLAEAVYHYSVLKNFDDVRDAYLQERPSEKRVWDAFAEAKTKQNELTRNHHGLLARAYSSITKPPELSGQYFPEVEGATEIKVNPQKELAAQHLRHLTGGAA
jgi:hypothetical protein